MGEKRAILIGSGSDLNGRGMGRDIDRGFHGIIARVNRLYGALPDVGARTDVLFTFHPLIWDRACKGRFGKALPYRRIVIPQKISGGRLYEDVKERFGLKKPTTGLLAAAYLISQGYHPEVVGFGFRAGVLVNFHKTYPDGRPEDERQYAQHDFDRENEILQELHCKGDLTLL